MAAFGFEVDHDGDLPTPLHNGGLRPLWWPNTIMPNLNMFTFNEGIPARPSAITCPTQFSYNESSRWTYSENIRFDRHQQIGFPYTRDDAVNRNLILRPAFDTPRWPVSETTLPYFMDGYTPSTVMYQSYRHRGVDSGMNNDGITRSYPHDLAANVMFLDGHVEKMVRGEQLWILPGDSTVTSRYLDSKWGF